MIAGAGGPVAVYTVLGVERERCRGGAPLPPPQQQQRRGNPSPPPPQSAAAAASAAANSCLLALPRPRLRLRLVFVRRARLRGGHSVREWPRRSRLSLCRNASFCIGPSGVDGEREGGGREGGREGERERERERGKEGGREGGSEGGRETRVDTFSIRNRIEVYPSHVNWIETRSPIAHPKRRAPCFPTAFAGGRGWRPSSRRRGPP